MDFIIEFNQIGECKINVDLVVEKWADNFEIFGYDSDEKVKYTFIVPENKKEGKLGTKCQIPENQAKEIISKLSLIRYDDIIFRRAFSYRNRQFYLTEIVRLRKLCIKEKHNPEFVGALDYAKQAIIAYSSSLLLIDSKKEYNTKLLNGNKLLLDSKQTNKYI